MPAKTARSKTLPTVRPLSATALNRLVARQRIWVVVDREHGVILDSAISRRRARDRQLTSGVAAAVIRQVDVRVTGVRA
jgi:hypothetical protein